MNANTLGKLFSFTSFGESHGPAVGCVVDGCPPRLPLSEDDIQPWLDRRRPGRSPYVSPRQEEDKVAILSGVFEGRTTGHPIMLLVENRNQRSSDYSHLRDAFRPGHADAVYEAKYGIRDPRGGGRSSARETVAKVAAGAVARRILASYAETAGVEVTAGLTSLGDVDANPFFCPDPDAEEAMRQALDEALAEGDSLGGIVEIRARNVPPGLGEPVYDRLDARIAAACMGLNAVKGVEIGDGFAAARRRGSENNDIMRAAASGRLADSLQTNHAGGVLGGISTGADIVVRCAVKPTPSIIAPQQSIDRNGHDIDLDIGGRHDPAVCIRAVPVLQSLLLSTLADFWLIARSRR